tara:strand:+ start:197 stop:586 length:390 start_codon:yes stop_codon:yes gene_type:complete
MYNYRIKDNDSRNFGFIISFILGIYSAYNFYHNNINLWIICLSISLLFVSLFVPKILNPITKLWILLGITLGKIISPIVLGLVFFGVVTPTSFIRKIFYKDPLNQSFNKKSKTYWNIASKNEIDLKNQF